MTTAGTPLAVPDGYVDWLRSLKGQIAQARQRATRSSIPNSSACTPASATTS